MVCRLVSWAIPTFDGGEGTKSSGMIHIVAQAAFEGSSFDGADAQESVSVCAVG